MLRRNFEKKNFWIFDLDNTIYDPKSKIFNQIDLRMKQFISSRLNISKEEAFKIQKKFYNEYGTTLSGLMKHYQIQPNEFLKFVHDVDLSKLKKCSNLFKEINKLPGRKIIYTNGDQDYAKRVLNSLGVESLFEYILDITKSKYIPKPSVKPLITYLNKNNINLKTCVYFEDLEKNLVNAHKYGITTVHIEDKINKKKTTQPFIDFRFKSILEALHTINKTYN
ncbi:pyrimidine 5'-nucleotidase [Alphaproteobacteria bacterium]|nr:pyrimidine 5'-nucleotidase [Alphaproteobacteria bacterium]